MDQEASEKENAWIFRKCPNGLSERRFQSELPPPYGIAVHQPSGCPESARDYPGSPATQEIINAEGVESRHHFMHYREMAQSLAKILTHTVFSTKDRRPYLPAGNDSTPLE
jgi:hypothetical protein